MREVERVSSWLVLALRVDGVDGVKLGVLVRRVEAVGFVSQRVTRASCRIRREKSTDRVRQKIDIFSLFFFAFIETPII